MTQFTRSLMLVVVALLVLVAAGPTLVSLIHALVPLVLVVGVVVAVLWLVRYFTCP